MSPDRSRTARTAATRAVSETAATVHPDGPAVLERYRLSRRLGTGAFGTVWLARDERLERDVAVKILARELVVDGRFEREARAAARLSHPGIVTLYEAEVDDEGAYLVSELVLGRTLDALLAEGALSDRDIVEIGLALCDALTHAHEQGVVHRDVKPSNVLIPETRSRSSSAAKLTDFGVARVIDSDSLTQTGDVIGTLAYMAPEQAAGLEAGEPADLYALALVLYEALSGVNPLRAASSSLRSRRVAVIVAPLRRQRRDLPQTLTRALDGALRPRIHERGTLHDLRDALARCLDAVGDAPGIVAGALDRTRDEGEDGAEGVTGRLWWSRTERGPAAPGARAAPPPPPEADPSRLIWQARALGAVGAAAATAWLSHRLLGTAGSGSPLAAPLAVTALVAAGVTLLLPRLGWLALVAYLCVGAVTNHEPGAAIVLAAAALVPIVLLPASPSLWPVAAAAPALGLIGLAGAWPALAGWSRSPWRRAMLGATGWLWTAVIGLLTGRTLYLPRPRGVAPAGTWVGSVSGAAQHGLDPLIRSGVLAPAALWAAAALLVPYLTGSRSPALDALRVIVWAAVLTVAIAPVITAVTGPGARSAGLSAPVAIGGATAAALLALAPAVARRMRMGLRARSFGGGVP